MSSSWRPLAATHCWRRSLKLCTARSHISQGIALTSSIIRSFSSGRVWGRCLNTFSFRYLQRKKSQMLKSGDRAGHPTSLHRETRRPGKISPKTFFEFQFLQERIVFQLGTALLRGMLNSRRKVLCIATTDRLFSKYTSMEKPRCVSVQTMLATEMGSTTEQRETMCTSLPPPPPEYSPLQTA
jgi:hypothetical protein